MIYKNKDDCNVIHTIIRPAQSEQCPLWWRELLSPPSQKEWVDATLLQMGYPDLTQVNTGILEKTKDLSARVIKQANPLFLFKSQEVTQATTAGFGTDDLEIQSRKWGNIAAMLSIPKEVCCFGLTLGREVETTNKAMSEKSIVQGFIWDALCSTLAEYYADRIEICLAFYYKKRGFQVSRRFSPGYCDLPLMQTQKAIFRFCDMESIGIRLSSSGLMTPRKSITGMVLAAANLPFNSPCGFCKRNCRYRRTNTLKFNIL